MIPEHIEQYSLPTAPPKATDQRAFVGQTVQAEALPPDVLASIVESAIEQNIDLDTYQEVVDIEKAERAELERWLERLR